MRTVVTALIAAALLVAGAFVAVAVSDNGVATAQQGTDETPRAEGLREILDDLVADGVINQGQADAVHDAIVDRGLFHGRQHFGGFDHLDEFQRLLGIDLAELMEQLREGSTLAEVAEANGIDLDELVDDFVASAEERLGDAVAGERMTQEEADELLASMRERIERFLNGEFFNEFRFDFGDDGVFRFGEEFGEGFHFRFDEDFAEHFEERFGEDFAERFREFSERFENGDTSFRGFGRGFGEHAETPADSA